MIVDITGIVLVPGNGGAFCPGNGEGKDALENLIECCCDECDYLLCCTEETDCVSCRDANCPHAKKKNGPN